MYKLFFLKKAKIPIESWHLDYVCGIGIREMLLNPIIDDKSYYYLILK